MLAVGRRSRLCPTKLGGAPVCSCWLTALRLWYACVPAPVGAPAARPLQSGPVSVFVT